MRILIWCPFVNAGGGIRLLTRLAPAIAEQPDVACVRLLAPRMAFGDHDLQMSQKNKLEYVALEHYGLRHWLAQAPEASGRLYRNRLLSAVMRRLLPRLIDRIEAAQLWKQSRDVDVVYAFWPHTRPFHPAQAPIVCTYQDTTFLDFPEILGSQMTEEERQWAEVWLRNAAQVVVSSQSVQERLIHHFGPQYASAEIIHHNISPDRGIPQTASPGILTALPRRYILYPANLNAHKNHEMLLIAWSRFAQRNQISLVLTGEGTEILANRQPAAQPTYWQHDRLVGLRDRLQLRPDKDFLALGYVPDDALTGIMRGAMGVIMPTLSEGGGSYPVEEALSNGIPVLCSDIPALREHVAMHTAEVVWFDPLSVDSIVYSLETFVKDYDLYKQSAVAGMQDPRPMWDDIASRYVDVFHRVIRSAIATRTR